MLFPMVKVSTARAPRSSSKPPTPSVTEETAVGLAGSVRSMIWTPLSGQAAVTAA